MATIHKNIKEHKLIVLEMLELNILVLSQLNRYIAKDKELCNKLDLKRKIKENGDLSTNDKSKVTNIVNILEKEKLIAKTTINDLEDILQVTEKGKQVIIQQSTEKVNTSDLRDPNTTQVDSIQKDKKALKTKEKQLNTNKYVSWTNPEFIESNNRWEFYKQDQDNQILEIIHSEEEEEIIALHKEKVMSHIMASLKQEEVETTKKDIKEGKVKNSIGLLQDPNKQRRKKEDSSVYIHQEIKLTIMRMKLEGKPFEEILKEVKKEYKLENITIGSYTQEVLEEIRERSRGIVNSTITDHLSKYEELFEWFRSNGYDKNALKSLERKELLLGLRNDEVVDSQLFMLVGFNGYESGIMYNLEQLNEKEKNRLKVLIEKTLRKE